MTILTLCYIIIFVYLYVYEVYMNDKKALADNIDVKKRIAPSLLSAAALTLTVLFFGPFELYANNIAEFSFRLGDFLGIFIAIAVAIIAALMLILIWLPKKVFDVACTSVALLALMTYVQGNFLNIGITSVEGDGVGEALALTKIVINAVIWVIVIGAGITAAILFSKRHGEMIRLVLTIAMVTVIGMQAVSVMTVALTTEDLFSNDGNKIESVEVLTYNNLDRAATDNNVVYFVVDRFASSYVETAKKECPEIFAELDGFTYYGDAVSLYPRTYPAITYMLTGVENDFSKTRADYFKYAWENSEFLDTLVDNGYDVNIYTDDYYAYEDSVPGGLPDYVANASGDTEIVVSDRSGLVRDMVRLSLYRYLPFAARGAVGNITSGDFLDHVEILKDDAESYSTDMKAAYDFFSNNPLTLDGQKNFSFVHLQGVHLPNKYDKDFNIATDDNKYSSVDAMIQSFKIINLYIEQMKELGIYDDATIIITGDHASIGSDTKDPYYAHITALFVKPSGIGEGELKTSLAPVAQEDIHATILDSEGIENTLDYGRSALDIGENEERERRYYFQRYIKEEGAYELVTYKIVGAASDFDNWEIVGREKIDKSIYD